MTAQDEPVASATFSVPQIGKHAQTIESDEVLWNDMNPGSYGVYGAAFLLTMDTVTYPIDLLKTRIQVSQESVPTKMSSMARAIWRTEGFKGFFRGYFAGVFATLPAQACYFTTYEYVKQNLTDYGSRQNWPEDQLREFAIHSASATAAELVGSVLYVPAAVVAQRLQVMSGSMARGQKAALDLITNMYKKEGFRGFYRGYVATICTYVPSSITWWASYEYTKDTLHELVRKKWGHVGQASYENHAIHFLAGANAGLLAAVVSNPLDVAKTRYQVLPVKPRGGFLSILLNTARQEGIQALFKGLRPRIMTGVPQSALSFTGYELIKQVSVRPDEI